ncbi:class I SAM-dependent methyltransferase, partial [bacterium]|nr:class I SAM-dependent methyltransferase [bacterium]
IKERVSSIYEKGTSKYQNLYYFIVSTLEDSHGLYSLGDTKNSVYKLLILDTITYDLVCAGVTAVSEINKQVGELQRSKDAGNLEKFKEITENNLQLVSKRGLLESVHFTQTEERIFSFAANEIIKKAERIKKIKNKREIQYLLSSSGAVETENIKFWLPGSIEPPLTGYFISMLIDKKWGLVINIHFQSENVKKESLLLALWNLFAYKEGLAVNNNESLESQIHYLLIQMRMADWILKNSTRFGIKDTSNLIQYRKWYQDAFERLAEESFMPQYYEQLFEFKQSAQIEKISFGWKIKNKILQTVNSPLSDDYIFYIMGNGSQMTPNKRLEKFIENEKFSSGTAFDLGCGDGSNTRLLVRSGLFKNVVAIDHSQAAVVRVKRLELLEPNLKNKITAVQSDIMKYKYPSNNSPIFQKASLIVIDNVIEYLAYKKRIALLQNLKNVLLKGGFIYIEYHLAGGEKFEELKSDLKIKVTENNDLITQNPFQGKQIKHFYQKGEILAELNKAQIKAETGFSVNENFVDEKNGFKVAIVVIKKD